MLNLHSNLSQKGIELSYYYTKDSSQDNIGEIANFSGSMEFLLRDLALLRFFPTSLVCW